MWLHRFTVVGVLVIGVAFTNPVAAGAQPGLRIKTELVKNTYTANGTVQVVFKAENETSSEARIQVSVDPGTGLMDLGADEVYLLNGKFLGSPGNRCYSEFGDGVTVFAPLKKNPGKYGFDIAIPPNSSTVFAVADYTRYCNAQFETVPKPFAAGQYVLRNVFDRVVVSAATPTPQLSQYETYVTFKVE